MSTNRPANLCHCEAAVLAAEAIPNCDTCIPYHPTSFLQFKSQITQTQHLLHLVLHTRPQLVVAGPGAPPTCPAFASGVAGELVACRRMVVALPNCNQEMPATTGESWGVPQSYFFFPGNSVGAPSPASQEREGSRAVVWRSSPGNSSREMPTTAREKEVGEVTALLLMCIMRQLRVSAPHRLRSASEGRETLEPLPILRQTRRGIDKAPTGAIKYMPCLRTSQRTAFNSPTQGESTGHDGRPSLSKSRASVGLLISPDQEVCPVDMQTMVRERKG